MRGRQAFREFNEKYPGDWTLKLDFAIASDSTAVSKIIFKVNNEDRVGISFFTFREGLVLHIEEYWPDSYEPPVRHSEFIEKY